MFGKIALVVGSVMVTAALADLAEAQVGCGDVVRPGETVVLQGDLGPCSRSTGPAAIVVDSAVLDLNGFTVSCKASRPLGIVLTGRRASVKNGTVSGCRMGVVLRGKGAHRVENVTAEDSLWAGFSIRSHHNRVTDSVATGNGTKGFRLIGDNNKLEDSTATDNGVGILVDGKRNLVRANTSADNRNSGLFVQGDHNRIDGNETTGNAGDGLVLAGKSSTAIDNLAQDNALAGMSITGEDNQAVRNELLGNTGRGLDVLGLDNRITGNRASGNGAEGVVVGIGATGNKLNRNVAEGNGAGDLVDANPNCQTNVWSGNEAGGNQSCVQ